MNDSHERIAADILISMIRIGEENSDSLASLAKYSSLEGAVEKVSAAYQKIFDTVRNAGKQK
ncbi:hypothetical protein ACL7TT_11480 [Microbulbifer sp. 2304DJ12-6]|uniref:hypothetical protein n=1 Tax=Microbulbifer sp. 2304DJ12-6 TaxID=3233340 RepID=UPI0039AFF4AE